MKFKIIMTVDVEEWFSANLIQSQLQKSQVLESTVVKNTFSTLELFKKHHILATFFVLGSVAEKYPDMVKEIELQGHEIGLHSYSHDLIFNMTCDVFVKNIEKGLNCLKKVVKQDIKGFRAPSWSVSEHKTPWFWDTLKANGFMYSSSVFPFHTFLYGNSKAPVAKYRVLCKTGYLWEIPPAVINIMNIRIPFSGGFYLRLLPVPILTLCIDRYFRKTGDPAVLYVHPYEIDGAFPRVPLSSASRFIQYYNLDKGGAKLEKILSRYAAVSVSQYYRF